MAYGEKYYGLFSDKANPTGAVKNYRVSFLFEGFGGSATEITLSGEPFKVTDVSRKDEYIGLNERKAEVGIIGNETLRAAAFYTESEKDIACRLYDVTSGSTLLWSGYVTPKNVQDPYMDGKRVFTVTAGDGLNYLKNTELLTDSLAYYEDTLQDLFLLRRCLGYTGVNLNFNTVGGLRRNGQAHDGSFDILAFTYTSADAVRGLNAYEVLERLCKKYNARLTQENGEWYFVRVLALTGTVYYRKWQADGTYISGTTYGAAQTLAYNGSYQPIGAGAIIGYEQSFKKISAEIKLGKYKNRILNGDFADVTAGSFDDWTEFNSPTLSQTGSGTAAAPYKAQMDGVSSSSLTAPFLYQIYELGTDETALDYRVIFSGKVDTQDVKGVVVRCNCVIIAGGITYVFGLNENGEWVRNGGGGLAVKNTDANGRTKDSPAEWSVTSGRINDIVIFNAATGVTVPTSSYTQVQVEVSLYGGIEAADVNVGASADPYVAYYEVGLQVINVAVNINTAAVNYTAYHAGNSPNNEELTLYYADMPDSGQEVALLDDSGDATDAVWITEGDSTQRELVHHLLKERLNVVSSPVAVWDGSIYGRPLSTLPFTIYGLTGVWIATNWSFNFGTAMAEGIRLMNISGGGDTILLSKTITLTDGSVLVASGVDFPSGGGNIFDTFRQRLEGLKDNLWRLPNLITLEDGTLAILKEGNEGTTKVAWVDEDGTETDYLRPGEDGFFYLKTEGNSEEQIATAETAWMLGGNTLTESKSLGSVSGDFDIPLIRNNATIATLKSTGLAVPSLTSGYLPKAGTGGLMGDSQILDNGTETGVGGILGSVKFNINSTLSILGNFNFPSTGGYMRFQNNGSSFADMGSGNQIFSGGNLGDFGISSRSGSLVLGSASTRVLTIDTYQNVIIGTTSGTKKLTVNGDIQGTELTLTTGTIYGNITFNAIPSTAIAPTTSNHLTNKTYVDTLFAGTGKWGVDVKTISLSNITLSGTQTVSGYALSIGERVLVAGQTTASQNGIYIVASGAWTRATDSDSDAELRSYVYTVSAGDYSGYKYRNSNTSAITVDTTDVTYVLFDNNTETDPVFVAWRDGNSVTTGTYRSVTVDTYGRVTAGTNPTTISGYGITDFDDNADTWFEGVRVNPTFLVIQETSLSQLDISGDVNFQVYANSSGAFLSPYKFSSGVVKVPLTVNAEYLNISSYIRVNGTAPTTGQVLKATSVSTMAWSSLSSSDISDVYSETEVDNLLSGYVDLTSDQTISGSKSFSGITNFQSNSYIKNLSISNIAGDVVTAVPSFGNDSSFIGLKAGSSAMIPLYFGSTIGYAFNSSGLLLGGTIKSDTTIDEKLTVVGNIQYSALLKPSGTAGTDGQFLSTDGTNDGWVDLLSSHITDWSADLNIGGHIFADGGISQTVQLTDGDFERVFKGLYLSGDGEYAETVFVGTDFIGNGEFVIRNQYYDESNTLAVWEHRTLLWNEDGTIGDGRLTLVNPLDNDAVRRDYMFKDEFATMLSNAGVSTGNTPTLQEVLDAGTGDTTKQISLNNSPYITRKRFDELTANFGGAQGLKSVLSNGTLAENQEINFQQTSATGTGSGSGLVFLDENSVEKGYLNYSNNDDVLSLSASSGYMKIYSSGEIDLRNASAVGFSTSGSNLAVYADKLLVTYDLELQHVGPDRGIILKSPDGTRYRVTIDNSGNLNAVAV